MSMIAKVRQFWDARPCNIRHSPKAVGTIDYFNEVEIRKYFVEPHIPDFAEFDKWCGKKVLEIGCGIGTDTINFARFGANVTAVDLSTKSLNIAKMRANAFGEHIKFYDANVECLSNKVAVKPYDLVYSFGVIHHTPNPTVAIQEIKKYMKPGSILKIMVYNRWSWKVLGIIIKHGWRHLWDIDRSISMYSEAQTGCPVTYTFTKRSIAKLLDGFKIESMEIEHIFPYVVSEYKDYRYKKHWYFRMMPNSIFSKLEKILGWHLCVTAKFIGDS